MKNRLMIVLTLASVISFGSVAFAQNTSMGNAKRTTTARPSTERREGKRMERRETRAAEARESGRHHRKHRRHVGNKNAMNPTRKVNSRS